MHKHGKILLVLLALLLLALPALAHERRDVGDYTLVFGWRAEPAIAGFTNGPEIYVRLPEGVEGDMAAMIREMDVTLQVEVTFGPSTITLDMRPDFRDPTHYIADLIPTRPGDYSFRVFGNIGDLEVDEVFTSADGEFSSVEAVGDVTFPDQLPLIIELTERIAALEARLAELEAAE